MKYSSITIVYTCLPLMVMLMWQALDPLSGSNLIYKFFLFMFKLKL